MTGARSMQPRQAEVEKEESELLLSDLPPDVLELVVSNVAGGKNGLRLTCHSLRSAVDACAAEMR